MKRQSKFDGLGVCLIVITLLTWAILFGLVKRIARLERLTGQSAPTVQEMIDEPLFTEPQQP